MAFATIVMEGVSPAGCKLVMADGSFFIISQSIRSLVPLYDGQELTEEACNNLLHMHQSQTCKSKALSLLAMHEQTRDGLLAKLGQRGFSQEIVHEVLDHLEADGLLSDRRFAQSVVAARQRKNPEGKFNLIQRLVSQGVSVSVATEVVDQWFSDHDAVVQAVRKAANRSTRHGKDGEAVVQALKRKGFTVLEIRESLED